MEGSRFIFHDSSSQHPDQVCTDCGQVFEPRRVGDGAEELCDTCYEARFQPLHSAKRHLSGPSRARRSRPPLSPRGF